MRGAGCLVLCLAVMAFGWLLPLLAVPLLLCVPLFALGTSLGWLLWRGWRLLTGAA